MTKSLPEASSRIAGSAVSFARFTATLALAVGLVTSGGACSKGSPGVVRADIPMPSSEPIGTSSSSAALTAKQVTTCAATQYPDSTRVAESGEVPKDACPAGMVAVRGATFTTVANDGTDGQLAAPSHRVAVDGFCIDRTEVPVGEFNRCGPCVAANGTQSGAAERPMRGIAPADMARYCAEQGKRLPSEDEWELAAQGAPSPPVAKNDPHCFLSGAPAPCNTAGTPTDKSTVGALDMAGNVRELTSTEICSCTKGPGDCNRGWVVRGGDFTEGTSTRVRRLRETTDGTTSSQTGFRCAKGLATKR